MKYLVMHKFKSYGVWFHRGDIVDGSKIRNCHLRLFEAKIVPSTSSDEAVSSSNNLPVDAKDTQQEDITKTEESNDAEPVKDEAEATAQDEAAQDEAEAPAQEFHFNLQE